MNYCIILHHSTGSQNRKYNMAFALQGVMHFKYSCFEKYSTWFILHYCQIQLHYHSEYVTGCLLQSKVLH